MSVVICKNGSKVQDLVTRAASQLKDGGETVILGRSATLTKAVTVAEIIKRTLGES